MNIEKRRNAYRLYREISVKLQSMEAEMLELLRHPDATDEHITVARTAYANAHAQFLEARAEMGKAGFEHRFLRLNTKPTQGEQA